MFLLTLTLLVATGSLADSEFLTGRRQNYNSNANVNALIPGYGKPLRSNVGAGRGYAGLYGGSPKYDIVLGPDVRTGKDRGGLYGGSPKYDIVLGPGVANGKDRSGLYGGSPKYDIVLGPDMIKGKERGGLYGGSPKYEIVLGPDMIKGKERGGLYGGPQKYEIVLGPDMVNGRDRGGLLKYVKGGTGNGAFMSDYLAGEDNSHERGSCDALANILFREDDDELAVIKEPTDVDGSLESLFDDNGNYNVVFKGSNRRLLSQQPYGVNAGAWESNGPSSNAVGSKHHQTYNWGTLRPTHLGVDENDITNRDYNRNSLLYDRTEPNYESPGQEYDRDYRDTNVNSNTNYNIFGGRRGNENSNTNDILFSFEDDGQDEENIRYGHDEENMRYGEDEGNRRYIQAERNRRYGATPSYSGYGRAGPGYGPQGSYGGYTTGYPTARYTPRSNYAALLDSDVTEDAGDVAKPQQNVNSNVNSNANSNVNVMSRRQNTKPKPNNNLFPRKKRSVKKFSNASGGPGREKNGGVSTVPQSDVSTTAKPVAEILEKPQRSIHRDLM